MTTYSWTAGAISQSGYSWKTGVTGSINLKDNWTSDSVPQNATATLGSGTIQILNGVSTPAGLTLEAGTLVSSEGAAAQSVLEVGYASLGNDFTLDVTGAGGSISSPASSGAVVKAAINVDNNTWSNATINVGAGDMLAITLTASYGVHFYNSGVINVTGTADNYGLVAFFAASPDSAAAYGDVVLDHGLALAGFKDGLDPYQSGATSGDFYLSHGSGLWVPVVLNYTNVYFLDGAANGLDLSPQASGTLYQFNGSIFGFQAGDYIQLEEYASMSLGALGATYADGVLTVTAHGGHTTIGVFRIVGDYAADAFSVTEVSGNDLDASFGLTHRVVITVATPANTWVASTPTHYNVADAWSSTPVPNGSANAPVTATIGTGDALLSSSDPALSNITLTLGALAYDVGENTDPTSVLEVTDVTLGASVTLEAGVTGGLLGHGSGGATGVSGLYMHGNTTTSGRIVVEAGNALFLEVTPTDATTSATGLYVNAGEIDVTGDASNSAALIFGQTSGYKADSVMNYGVVKASYAYVFAYVNDAAGATPTTGDITLSNHSTLSTTGGALSHTNIVFGDNTSELLLSKNDAGLYDFGSATGGSLSGLQAGDVIGFVDGENTNPTSLSYDYKTHVLTVSNGDAVLGTVQISGADAGNYRTANFLGVYNSQGNLGSYGEYDVHFVDATDDLTVLKDETRRFGETSSTGWASDALSVAGTASIYGQLDVDADPTATGGSLLGVAGLMTIYTDGAVVIGDSGAYLDYATTVKVGALDNQGALFIASGSSTGRAGAEAILVVDSVAGTGVAGDLSGTIELTGNAILDFASGTISTLSGALTLDGYSAQVATGARSNGHYTSALSSLSAISQGASLTLTNTSFKDDVTLANAGVIKVGDGVFGANASFSSLSNAGTFDLLGNGNSSSNAYASVQGALGNVSGGVIDVSGGANLSVSGFASNASGATINLSGVHTANNWRYGGASFNSGLNNAGAINVSDDAYFNVSASAPVAAAAATNTAATNTASGVITIGDGNSAANAWFSSDLSNAGTIDLIGKGSSSNNVHAGFNGALSNLSGGVIGIKGGASLSVGGLASNAFGATINLSGVLDGNTWFGGASFNGGLANAGAINVSGNGSLNVGAVAATNAKGGVITVGDGKSGDNAWFSSDLNNAGTIDLIGCGSSSNNNVYANVGGALGNASGGVIDVSGGANFNVSGLVSNESGATINLGGVAGANNWRYGGASFTGGLTNAGAINVSDYAYFNVSSYAPVAVAAVSSAASINTVATNTASGVITIGSGKSVVIASFFSDLNNAGAIKLIGNGSSSNNVSASINGGFANAFGGVIDVSGGAGLNVSGLFSNASGATIKIGGVSDASNTFGGAWFNGGLSNRGTIAVESSGFMGVSGSASNAAGAVIDLIGGPSSATGYFTGGLSNAGTIHVENSGALSVYGSASNAAGAVIAVGGGKSGANAWFSNGLSNAGTINVNSAGFLHIEGSFQNATSGDVKLASDNAWVRSVTATINEGLIEGFGDFLGANLTNAASGKIDANVAGSTLTLSTNESLIVNDGVLAADGGTLQFYQGVTGSGHAEISAGGTLAANGFFDQDVTFIGAGAETFRLSNSYTHTITGFGAGDKIDLTWFTYGVEIKKEWLSEHELRVWQENYASVTLKFSEVSGTIKVTDLGNGQGAEVTVICFMAGTLVRTPFGEVAIETLKRGDLVLTSEGKAAPVTWLGRQTVSRRFADPVKSFPIRIRAHALGDTMPARDLLVSPDHALLVGGVLVHAGALVNGTSITREADVPETFVYYHVELDDHSLILAENVPAETFVDTVDRLAFDNWAEHETLYPQGKPIDEMVFPRAKSRRQVPSRLLAAIDARADALGHVPARAA